MKDFFKNIKYINRLYTVKAFTLVETLAATLIISVIILGPLTVAINASTYARQTKNIMIATYLAQESVELIHHLQDSLYLKCISDVTGVSCPATDSNNDGVYDEPSELAWRMLKTDLTSGVSCFAAAGCAYDFINITENDNNPPVKYLPTDALCSTLSLTSDNLYVCSGSHGGVGSTATSFTRKVNIERIDIPTGGDADYVDGLRVTVIVTFIRANGYTRSVKLVDFLRAHK